MSNQNLIELFILGITNTPSQKNSYTIIFGNEQNELKLPIVVGSFEAQSIALVIEGISPSRPLTHDLIMNIFDASNIELKEVRIVKLHEGVFHATLFCHQEGKDFEVDSRSSDAIALALRSECPIYTVQQILDEAGVILDAELTDDSPSSKEKKSDIFEPIFDNDYSKMTLDELKNELDKVIQIEDYDAAVIIRDEIEKRRK
jgi:uncharacterized protein